MKVAAYAALAADRPLSPFVLERRDPAPDDVVIDILFCGICHSDLHQARDEWKSSSFPMVPGHEIIGRVSEVGAKVARLRVGDLVGVGCLVGSCGACESCVAGHEQLCDEGCAWTYNGTEMDRKTPTYGGYSARIVVNDRFVLKVPPTLDPERAAPLLCAGITTYSPMRRWNIKKGNRVAVLGLGGLGHMAVKFGVAFGAHVTVLSTSRAKEADAGRLGAAAFQLVTDPSQLPSKTFDFLIDTVSAPHDYATYLALLKPYGTMTVVGVPAAPAPLHSTALIDGNRSLTGSLIGGVRETQEMLEFCAQHAIHSDTERITPEQIDDAYDRMLRGDVRYRFVMDVSSLARPA